MKKLAIFLALAAAVACSHPAPRAVEDFNFDWKFTLGDSPELCGPDGCYLTWTAENFDDSDWRSLHLPHDWSVEGDFSAENPSTPGGGALPGGIGWYRKHFPTPEIEYDSYGNPSKSVMVEFDGVFMNSTVYVNGQECGTRPYGYSSFCYDITYALNKGTGADNVIAVRCDNADQPNSRWYAGCGIYRNVRLVTTSAVHVAYNGIWAKPVSTTADKAVLAVETTVDSPYGATYDVKHVLLDAAGKKVASGVDTLTVKAPHLWDVNDPYLYTLVTTVSCMGTVIDEVETAIGMKICEWDVDHGFFLNGRPLKLLGVCLHHDMGCLGTAVHKRALERELTILKDMGVNSIRTSHNPPAPELLQLCDEMGLLVFDEAMDMWRKKKTQFDYSRFFDEWHERDMQDFIRRDRNHASVFMWSIGNEILEQWNSSEDDVNNLTAEQANLLMNFMSSLPQYEAGDDNPNILLTKHMVALIKELDETRPVSAGCNETQQSNNLLRSGALDVYGFNYHTWDYDKVREWYPDKPLFGSETASSLNSRGYYPQPSTDIQRQPKEWWLTYETPHHQCPAYDNMCAPWADLHEHAWVEIRDREYMAGTYLWTGFDYLGEPTPYSWPSRSSYFGVVDLAGFPKDVYWMYQSEWTDKTVLHLFPHWNWNEGDTVDVWAYYSNADEVELFLNGESLGKSRKEGEQLRAQWLSVPFAAGTIEAVSYKDGKEVARESRVTTGEPVALKLTPDRSTIDADGYDLSYVTVEAVDAEGRAVPTADLMLHFEVSGAGELAGIDNGNAADTLSLKGHDKAIFNGKALAVVRSLRGEKGTAVLKVTSEVGEMTTEITTK